MLLFHILLTALLAMVFLYDLTRYIIPNWLCALILALYPAMLLMAPQLPAGFSIWWSLAVFAAVFTLGLGFFALKWMGGGDVKLLAVLALWAGREATFDFLIYTAALGGLLALAMLLVRVVTGYYVPAEKAADIPRILRHREPLPYGLAITAGFAIVLWMGRIPGLPV